MRNYAVVICLCLSVTGCQSTPFNKKSEPPPVELLNTPTPSATVTAPGLMPAAQRRFKDIPLPVGLREDTQSSFVYDSKSVKIGKMVYWSKDSVNALAQFYVTHAPSSDWRLLSTTQADDSIILYFEKPGRRLNVEVKRRGMGRNNTVIINYLPEEER